MTNFDDLSPPVRSAILSLYAQMGIARCVAASSPLGATSEEEAHAHVESDFQQVATLIHSSFGVFLDDRAQEVGEMVYIEAFEMKAQEIDLELQAFRN